MNSEMGKWVESDSQEKCKICSYINDLDERIYCENEKSPYYYNRDDFSKPLTDEQIKTGCDEFDDDLCLND